MSEICVMGVMLRMLLVKWKEHSPGVGKSRLKLRSSNLRSSW